MACRVAVWRGRARARARVPVDGTATSVGIRRVRADAVAMDEAADRLSRLERWLSKETQVPTPFRTAGESDLALAPFAEAAARAAIALAQALGEGAAGASPGQMETMFALQYIRRNVACLGEAADGLSVPTGREDVAGLVAVLQSLATALSAGDISASGGVRSVLASAGDVGCGQTALYELPESDGHVSTASVSLSNGLSMPIVGYGAFQMEASGIRAALDAGYRLIDTAESYRNEREVGNVLHEFLSDNPAISREDIWIVSKCSSSRGDTAARSNLERQLAELQVDYIDLYYLHSWEPDAALRAETWAVMEEYFTAGKIKALGISNHCASKLLHSHIRTGRLVLATAS